MNRVARTLATWFGCGLVPRAPGTAGSLGALPVYFLAFRLGGVWAVVGAAVLATLVGLWASDVVARETKLKDPQIVVIDEVAGMLISLIPATPHFATVAVAFVAFRVLDSTKPWPIAPLERFPGGVGIMMDDVGAGVVSALLVAALRHWNVLP